MCSNLICKSSSADVIGITTTWIFLHNIAEFSFFALRWALLDGLDNAAAGYAPCTCAGDCCRPGHSCASCRPCWTLSRMVMVTATYFTIAAIIMMLTDSPYNKGFISGVPTIIADFGNLVIGPYMAYHLYQTGRGHPIEIMAAVMSVLHVILFYGQV